MWPGVAYAGAQLTREVQGSFMVGNVVGAEEILLYSRITPTSADLTALAFGSGDINSSGDFIIPPRVPFWAAVRGDGIHRLTLVAANVKINGVPASGDVLALLMGTADGAPLPAPAHARIIVSGEPPVALAAGLKPLKAPSELGLQRGDSKTFTAVFKAEPLVVAGDVNGDGKADFIVGTYAAGPGGRNAAGIAYVYSGADGSLLYERDGLAAYDQFGQSVGGAK